MLVTTSQASKSGDNGFLNKLLGSLNEAIMTLSWQASEICFSYLKFERKRLVVNLCDLLESEN